MRLKGLLRKSSIIRKFKENISQVSALVEKNLNLAFRFKLNLIFQIIFPIITIIMPLILMNYIFAFNNQIGSWTESNFIVYQLIAFNINILRLNISTYPSHFNEEKFWNTLPALIIGPFNRMNLLFGTFFSQLIILSVPLSVSITICWFFYQVSFFTLLVVILEYLLIALVFSGIGIILGIFTISNENVTKLLQFIIQLVIWLSCVTFPFEIFPDFLKNIIRLNPLYYILDILRFTWLNDDIFVSFSSNPFHFVLLGISAVILPLIGVFIFNKVYRKYGIVGY
jgi:ABC-2 type transport system permease protein